MSVVRVSTQHVPVCTLKTSSCMPATRAHVETHVRVVPAYTGTFRMYAWKRFESTHGVIASSAYQEKPTYSSHLPQRGSPHMQKTSENHVLLHTPHNIHHTDHTLLSCLVSSLLFSSHVHLFRNLVEINLRQHARWKSSTT